MRIVAQPGFSTGFWRFGVGSTYPEGDWVTSGGLYVTRSSYTFEQLTDPPRSIPWREDVPEYMQIDDEF